MTPKQQPVRKDWKTMLKSIATTDISSKTGIAKYAYRPEVVLQPSAPSKPAGFSLEQVAALVMARP